MTIEKQFQILCCRSGPLTGTVYLPETGFECQKIMPFQFRIDNNSQTPTTEFMVEFCKVRFHFENLKLSYFKNFADNNI